MKELCISQQQKMKGAVDIKNNLVICKTNSSALVRTMRRLSKPPKKHLYVTLSQMFVFFQRHLPTKPTPPEQRLDKRRLLVEAPPEDPAVGLAGQAYPRARPKEGPHPLRQLAKGRLGVRNNKNHRPQPHLQRLSMLAQAVLGTYKIIH